MAFMQLSFDSTLLVFCHVFHADLTVQDKIYFIPAAHVTVITMITMMMMMIIVIIILIMYHPNTTCIDIIQ